MDQIPEKFLEEIGNVLSYPRSRIIKLIGQTIRISRGM